jgi:hypothetical protein
LAAAGNQSVRAPSCCTAVDERSGEENTTLATTNRNSETVFGTEDFGAREAGDNGSMLTIEVKWIWNDGLTKVVCLGIEMKLEQCNVSESIRHVKMDLWDRVLDTM